MSELPEPTAAPDAAQPPSRPQTAHAVTLVIGGGGAAGNAWAVGIIAGLAAGGIDLTRLADLVIGTSAGATAAALVRSGTKPAELYASILREADGAVGRAGPARPAGSGAPAAASSPQHRPGAPSAPSTSTAPGSPMSAVFERMRAISAAATSPLDLQRAMGAYGLESDAAFASGSAAEHRRAIVASRLPHPEWPERPMIAVAVDAHTGEAVLLDRDSGVDLVDAVVASTSLPGAGPTLRANGTNYVSGGVRSPDNADLAAGATNVVVISPLGGRTGPLPEGQFEGLQRPSEWGFDLVGQLAALREQGTHVEVFTPDDESRDAMGINQMDPATRIPSARAGFAQAERMAKHVRLV